MNNPTEFEGAEWRVPGMTGLDKFLNGTSFFLLTRTWHTRLDIPHYFFHDPQVWSPYATGWRSLITLLSCLRSNSFPSSHVSIFPVVIAPDRPRLCDLRRDTRAENFRRHLLTTDLQTPETPWTSLLPLNANYSRYRLLGTSSLSFSLPSSRPPPRSVHCPRFSPLSL